MKRLLVALVLLWGAAPASAQVALHTVALTTDGSGDVTAYTPTTSGTVLAVRYVPDASTPLATGADITITDTTTGLTILTITNVGVVANDFWPRAAMMTTTGVLATYDGTRAVLDQVPVASAIQVVVAQGGSTLSGTIYLYVQGR